MKPQYAVFGNPAEHSLSPVIHSHFAHQTGIAMEYQKHTIAIAAFEDRVMEFFAHGGAGLNITVPFKLRAYRLSEQRSDAVVRAKAANTLWSDKGKICADNTDGVGLVHDIHSRLDYDLTGKLLILGAGGAARGILASVLEQNPVSCTIANRTVTKAQQLVSEFASYSQLHATSFDNLHSHYDCVINATSISLQNNSMPFPQRIISTDNLCYDLAYNRSDETAFCRWALDNGCQHVSDGLGMLIEQAAQSFFLWTGKMPQTDEIFHFLQKKQ